MLKACSYCGKIHAKNFSCPNKPTRNWHGDTEIRKFRNSKEWREKTHEIRERDHGLCMACAFDLPHTLHRVNTSKLSVHHIRSLKQAWHLRLANSNLILLCDVHHELAERGEIKASALRELIGKDLIPPGRTDA